MWLVVGLLLFAVGGLVELYFRAGRKRALRAWGEDLQQLGLVRREHTLWRTLHYFLSALGLTSLFVCLARPQWGTVEEKKQHEDLCILFAIDTSKSMLAEDVSPNRLALAKLSIVELLEQLKGHRLGLVAFAGDAFLQCPLTKDYGAFSLSLDAVDTTIIQKGGTDIAAALQVAQQAFEEGQSSKYLVLITDGEDLGADGIRQAKIAAKQGVVVYTVGVGSAKGERIPIRREGGRIEYLKDERGQYVTTRLDETTLNEIAETTRGFYIPLGNAGEGLRHIYETTLSALPKESFESVEQVPVERYALFAVIALLAFALEACLCWRFKT
jgi:Ca-activated chloride channel family protein